MGFCWLNQSTQSQQAASPLSLWFRWRFFNVWSSCREIQAGQRLTRFASDLINAYLQSEIDGDGDGESKPLTDGLLLIRYLFGFSGDSLISGAIGSGAERETAEEVEAYIEARLPPSP